MCSQTSQFHQWRKHIMNDSHRIQRIIPVILSVAAITFAVLVTIFVPLAM
jgi:uncharacterized membrane protein